MRCPDPGAAFIPSRSELWPLLTTDSANVVVRVTRMAIRCHESTKLCRGPAVPTAATSSNARMPAAMPSTPYFPDLTPRVRWPAAVDGSGAAWTMDSGGNDFGAEGHVCHCTPVSVPPVYKVRSQPNGPHGRVYSQYMGRRRRCARHRTFRIRFSRRGRRRRKRWAGPSGLWTPVTRFSAGSAMCVTRPSNCRHDSTKLVRRGAGCGATGCGATGCRATGCRRTDSTPVPASKPGSGTELARPPAVVLG